MHEILNGLGVRWIKGKVNLFICAPHSQKYGEEGADFNIMVFENLMLNHDYNIEESSASRIVPRVGFDVQSSCGMFISDQGS